ncbi:MAG: Ig-like domain-containing protein, partial [Clostridia bacterium]|nr:Ig-like domain-containing protein [Clostridia bacterium]
MIILITALLLPVIALAETEPEKVVLSAETIVIDLAEDDEAKLTGYILPAEAEQDIDWKTNDRDIARYSSGKIRGREIGTTYITATSEEDPSVSAVCQIVVIDSDIPESVVLSQYSAELDLAGNTKLTLSASALPAGANQRVSWKTSSSSIAKVSSSGVVTARRTGTAVITAYSKESSKVYAECIVTVIDSDIPEYIGLNQTNITLDLRNNTSFDLDAVAYPPFANQDIEWDSSSSSVVRVSSKGVLTARKVGTATVKAISEESSKVYAECLVTVIDTRIPESISFENADETLTMDRYQTVTLMPVVEPSFADQRVEWKSSNSSVVSVSDAGKLTAKKAGTATITCKSERSGAVKASLTVTVKQYP